MDDLAGLDWSSAPSSSHSKSANAPAFATTPSYPALRPSPSPSPLPSISSSSLSGRSTPLSNQPSGPILNRTIGSKPTTPANDSFSSLLSIGGAANKAKAGAGGVGVSLQERQRQLQEEKARQEAERARKNGYAGDTRAWEAFGSGSNGSGKSTPDPGQSRGGGRSVNGTFGGAAQQSASFAAYSARKVPAEESESDILAAFDAAAPVDASSHFPVPKRVTPRLADPEGMSFGDDDDDPFGLGRMPQSLQQSRPAATAPSGNDDFDILGDLGKPVSELPPKPLSQTTPAQMEEDSSDDDMPADPRDKAVAELVDMGFPAAKAAEALEQTSSGVDVQAAVGWLVNQAHSESKAKKERSRDPSDMREAHSRSREPTPRGRTQNSDDAVPAWARSGARRHDTGSPAPEKDVTQFAQEIGTTLFKSANSLWKTGRKQVQKAVAEFQQESDSGQPKWMRDAQAQEREAARRGKPQSQSDVTDEAMMLEAGAGRPPGKPTTSRPSRPDFASDGFSRRETSQTHLSADLQRPRGRLTREDIDEQSSQAYVSPARRKKAPTPSPDPFAAEDRFHSKSPEVRAPPVQAINPLAARPAQAAKSSPLSSARSTPKPPSTPIPTRPKAPPRAIPSVATSALATSTRQRKLGTDAFKRGDYGVAHELYTRALAPLPAKHPVTIVILTNRALTGLKTGDPKSCIADADAALAVIGVSRGDNENINLGPGEEKSMAEYWGKALTRKAEALENMEKWADAAKVWREAVEAGVGGALAIQGRNRCDKAAGNASAPSAATSRTATPAARRQPLKPPARPAVSTHKSAEAVRALREANKAAERADDEKFGLVDQVDAKLVAWKGTKADNLRALLGSLDNVLWPEAGWKKVGMGDLVMPNKVKIIYMKAIAKVHPDKLSQTATTEQKMISAAVFSTLNEAWDKFKTDNRL